MSGVEKKLVLITGSGKRLGAAMALHFAKSNYDVIVHYNNSQVEAKAVVDEIKKLGSNAIMIKANLTEGLDPFIEEVKNSSLIRNRGGLDVLINSASKYEKMNFESVTTELWDEMHTINNNLSSNN